MTPFSFVFLGNPGREYERTRHNIGWMVADYLEYERGLSLQWFDKFEGKLATYDTKFNRTFLFKPQCFMNLSGNPVRKLFDFYKLTLKNIVVIHDDLELPFGELSFKTGGGSGGHNGLRSIDVHLGSSAYIRCRIGIGRPKHGDVSSFVLSRFSNEEEISLPLILESAGKSLQQFSEGGKLPSERIQAMQTFSSRKK